MTEPKFEIVTIDPTRAQEMLDNTRINRPLRGDQVEAYARDMRAGNWRPVGDPIRVDRLGNTIDGQHRLTAIVKSGVTLNLIVVNGLEPTDQLVIDSGVKRRAADLLTLEGRKYGARVASVARQLFAIKVGRAYDQKLRVTNQEIFEILESNPGIVDSVIVGDQTFRQCGLTPLNAAVIHYIGTRNIPMTTYTFFEKLKSGANMTSTDPALLLRNRLLSTFDVGSKGHQLWLGLRALELTKLKVMSYTKIQLPRDSKVTPEVLKEIIFRIQAFADERLEVKV